MKMMIAGLVLAFGAVAAAAGHGDLPKCGAGEVVVVHSDGSKHCVKESEAEKSCPNGGSAMRSRVDGSWVYLCSDKLPPR